MTNEGNQAQKLQEFLFFNMYFVLMDLFSFSCRREQHRIAGEGHYRWDQHCLWLRPADERYPEWRGRNGRVWVFHSSSYVHSNTSSVAFTSITFWHHCDTFSLVCTNMMSQTHPDGRFLPWLQISFCITDTIVAAATVLSCSANCENKTYMTHFVNCIFINQNRAKVNGTRSGLCTWTGGKNSYFQNG